jgi:hypothetical protein
MNRLIAALLTCGIVAGAMLPRARRRGLSRGTAGYQPKAKPQAPPSRAIDFPGVNRERLALRELQYARH